MSKSFYDVLGVASNATSHQIRQRFLELARERHPDRFRGADKEAAESEFQEITLAFNVLSDPMKRREHDLVIAQPSAQAVQERSSALQVYLQRGIKAYKEKNFLDAAENFTRATNEEPDNPRAWHYLALACSHQKRWHSRAVGAIVKACELEPMNPAYLKLAGRLCEQSDKSTLAEKYYASALTWGGEDPEVRAAVERIQKGKKGKSGFFG